MEHPKSAIDIGSLRADASAVGSAAATTQEPIFSILSDILDHDKGMVSFAEARELFGRNDLSGTARTVGERAYQYLTDQLRNAAKAQGLGAEFEAPDAAEISHIKDFVNTEAPLAKALKGTSAQEIMGSLSDPGTAEILEKYRGFGIDAEAIQREVELYRKYKNGVPQIKFSPIELLLDIPTLGLATLGRLAYNFIMRLRAIHDLRSPVVGDRRSHDGKE